MAASVPAEPPADAELLRLLDDYGDTERWAGEAGIGPYRNAARQLRKERARARAALLAHISSNYSRRWSSYPPHLRMPELYADLPEEVAGPPIVAGPLSRRKVTIRLSDKEG